MQKLTIPASREYEVIIDEYLLPCVGKHIRAKFGECRAVIVTDTTVSALYGNAVRSALESVGIAASLFEFEPGEAHKSLGTYARILGFLCEHGLSRSDLVIGLGGGIPGDLAGFAAATYLRGVHFMQLPTTLLAMVDSSVGGKTGVNLEAGKNLAGAFYQPELVLADVGTLRTLAPATYSDGIAEMLKCGVLADAELFAELSTAPSAERLPKLIRRCVEIKRDCVVADERDEGIRQLLNLGHTIGHALEKASAFTLTHGHAVAIGMLAMAQCAADAGLADEDITQPLRQALTANGLPTACPYTAAQLLPYIAADKKRRGSALTIVVPRTIGHCKLVTLATDRFAEMLTAALG